MPPTRPETRVPVDVPVGVPGAAELEETELGADRHGDVPESEDVFLVCRDHGATRVLAIAPGESVVVGRAPDSTLVTSSARVSRRHATIRLEGGLLSIADHASRNGTTVNGKSLRDASQLLDGGDVIGIGAVQIVVARADHALSRAASRATSEETHGDSSATPEETHGDSSAPQPRAGRDGELGLRVRRRISCSPIARWSSSSPSPVAWPSPSPPCSSRGRRGRARRSSRSGSTRLSARGAEPFLRLNCASLPEALIEERSFSVRGRRVHRRRSPSNGILRGRERGHLAARRDRRDAAERPGQVAARPRASGDRTGRRDGGGQRRRPHPLRDPP